MRIEIDFDVSDIELDKADGQVNIKMPKELELKFKMLNIKYGKKLSRLMRKVAGQIVDQVERAEAS
jgi:hypothetical protein